MQHRSGAAYALAVGLFAVAVLEVLTTVVGALLSGLGWDTLRDDLVLSNALLGLMLAVPGFLLAGHRPGNPIGWLLLGGGVGYATSAAGYVVLVLGTEPGESGLGWRLVATATNFGWPWAVGLSIPLSLLLFPDGRPLGPRWRWLVGIAVVNGVLFSILIGVPAGGLSTSAGVEGLPALTAPWLRVAWTWLTVPGLIIYALGLVSLVLRYRRGDAVLRQQIGWVLLAVIALVVLQVASALWPGDDWLGILSLGLLPIGITVAILRANLLDIRIVVSRSLLYLVLTGGIALTYLGLVAVLSWLSLGLNTGAAVVATVIIAVAFNPLRVRLQRLLDRAFYGARRDPVRALAAVGERLEVVAAPHGDGLTGVLEAVCSTLRLPWAAIVVDGVEVAGYGTAPPDRHGVPIRAGGEPVGELVVGLRPGEARIAAADERVLSMLAAPIGVAVQANTLAAEVGRSRERIISSREEERRRLRRDLHDGLGPVLTGVVLNAETALRVLAQDRGVSGGVPPGSDTAPARAEALLAKLRDQTTAAIEEIRRLVDDLGPPAALEALGLEGALREQAAMLTHRADGTPLAVSVEMSGPLGGLPAAVEVAIYRIVTEALTNVVRHSTARSALVAVAAEPGGVRVTVSDDGALSHPGVTPGWQPGVGLSSIRERTAELGGACEIRHDRAGGQVSVRLPVTMRPEPFDKLRTGSVEGRKAGSVEGRIS